MNPRAKTAWVLLFGLLSPTCGLWAWQSNKPSVPFKNTVQVEMHNVMYHFTDQIAVHIRVLEGKLIPGKSYPMPVFDDKNSFTLNIADAVIAIDTQSMANVLNTHVFSRADSPLHDVSIQIEQGLLKVRGKLHSKGDLPFETDAIPSATPDGKIRLHAKSIKAFHVPIKGLMDLWGIQIGNLIKTGKMPGIQVDKDDLILDARGILPPPHIDGKVTQVLLEGNQIVQVFGLGAKVNRVWPKLYEVLGEPVAFR